jgi:hypothetical protein
MADPTPHSRWFRVTPDRCVFGLLALEGFQKDKRQKGTGTVLAR